MALEDLTGNDKFITALVNTNPEGQDDRRQGDDHIKGVKNVLLNSFPNVAAPVTATPDKLNNTVDKRGDEISGSLTFTQNARGVILSSGGALYDYQGTTAVYIGAGRFFALATPTGNGFAFNGDTWAVRAKTFVATPNP